MSSAVNNEHEEAATESYKTYFKSQQDQELIRLALHKSAFFSCLDEEQLDVFVSTAELKRYKKGDIVILEGCVDEDDDENYSEEEEDIRVENSTIKATVNNKTQFRYAGLDDDESDSLGLADADEFLEDEDDNNEESQDDAGNSNLSTEQHQNSTLNENPTTLVDAASSKDTCETTRDDDEQKTNYSIKDENWLLQSKELQVDDSATPYDSTPGISPGDPRSTSCDSSDSDLDDHSVGYVKVNQTAHPPPPQSGSRRSIYIIRKGNAAVWYQPRFSPASLGPGTLFGEGGFLFGRQHSASIVACEDLECWVVDATTFRHHVLVSSNMRERFSQWATRRDENNNLYMTIDEFVEAISKEQNQGDILTAIVPDSLTTLRLANAYKILRRKKRKKSDEPKITLEDFCFFHLLVARPDPEVDVAFLLMDERQTGRIFLEDLSSFLKPAFPDLDFNSQFFQRYFGKKGNLSIRQMHFPQFLVDLQREIGKQAFLRAMEINGNHEGYMKPDDFVRILKTACGWLLPSGLVNRLEYIYCHDVEKNRRKQDRTNASSSNTTSEERSEKGFVDHYFAYGDFLAFQEVLGNLPFICNLIDTAQEMKGGPLSSDDFKVANRVLGLGGRLSRRQVDIVFQIFDQDEDGYISHDDTVQVCGVDYTRRLVPLKDRRDRLTFVSPEKLEQLKLDKGSNNTETTKQLTISFLDFTVAAAAGAFSVSIVFPLDVAKTRLMNQRLSKDGAKLLYRGSLDCLKQVFQAEGFPGLFRGLVPQLLGILPERFIKLQVHELLKLAFSSSDNNLETDSDDNPKPIPLWQEALAGGCAGASQLLVTNPMEITKIRMQLHGEWTATVLNRSKNISPPPLKFLDVVKGLGFPGVYRGASSCLLRDIPFSAIYFPAYAFCKERFAEANISETVSALDIIAAGTIAALPAALLTTPADVIKTRLQAVPHPGQTSYDSIRDCAMKIYQHEGYKAFFQGSLMRTSRIAPQFGLTLWAYESLMGIFGLEKNSIPPTTAPIDHFDYRVAFPKNGPGIFDHFFGNVGK